MRPWIRVAIAGFLGGVAMFFWASLAHLATPLASTGISQIAGEEAILKPMQATLGGKSGLYLFPRMDGQGSAAMQAYAARLATHPSGLLVYHPPGATMIETRQLLTEFGGEIAQALIVAVLMAWAAVSGYWRRLGFAALIGGAAALTTNLSYWNWYGFPGDYSLAYGGIEFIGYLAAGAVIAAVLPRSIPGALWAVRETRVSVAVGDFD